MTPEQRASTDEARIARIARLALIYIERALSEPVDLIMARQWAEIGRAALSGGAVPEWITARDNPQAAPGYERIHSWAAGLEPLVDWNARESIIGWLVWSDRHGCYTDEDLQAEGLQPLTLDMARDHMIALIQARQEQS